MFNDQIIFGPYGSGKTTYMLELLNQYKKLGSQDVYVILNDVLGSDIDKEKISSIVNNFSMMLSGCIGCGDKQQFQQILESLQNKDNLIDTTLMIEKPGPSHAKQIMDILNGFNKNPHVSFLRHAKNHSLNSAYKMFQTGIFVANTIVITHIPEEDREKEEIMNQALDWVERYKSLSSKVILLPNNDIGNLFDDDNNKNIIYPSHSLDVTQKKESMIVPLKQKVIKNYNPFSNKLFEISDDLDGTTGVKIYISDNISLSHLEQKIIDLKCPIQRAKGSISIENNKIYQIDYDLPQSNFVVGNVSNSFPQISIFVDKKYKDNLLSLVDISKDRDTYEGKPKEIMRQRPEGIELSQVLELITLYSNLYPQNPLALDGDNELLLTSAGDAEMGYYPAQQSDIPIEYKRKAFEPYLKFRIQGCELLKTGRFDNHTQYSEYAKSIGNNLAFHVLNKDKFCISDNLLQDIVALKPAHLCLDGLLRSEEFDFDAEDGDMAAGDRPEHIKLVIESGMKYEGLDITFVDKVINHCILLCENQNRKDIAQRWRK